MEAGAVWSSNWLCQSCVQFTMKSLRIHSPPSWPPSHWAKLSLYNHITFNLFDIKYYWSILNMLKWNHIWPKQISSQYPDVHVYDQAEWPYTSNFLIIEYIKLERRAKNLRFFLATWKEVVIININIANMWTQGSQAEYHIRDTGTCTV